MSDNTSAREAIRAQIHDAEYAAVAAKARYEALLEVEQMLKREDEALRREPRRGKRNSDSVNVTVVNPPTRVPWEDEDAVA